MPQCPMCSDVTGLDLKRQYANTNYHSVFMTSSIHVRFVFKFHGNRPHEVGETMLCFADKNSSQNEFFSAPFCARSARGAISLQGIVQHDLTSPCKISSRSVRFAGVIPIK